MATKKTRNDLSKLFDKMTEVMATMLDGEIITDKEGNEVKAPPSPATLSVIRQFLKDNRIEADPDNHQGLGRVANKFVSAPFPVDEPDDLTSHTVQ